MSNTASELPATIEYLYVGTLDISRDNYIVQLCFKIFNIFLKDFSKSRIFIGLHFANVQKKIEEKKDLIMS